jgi:hypothetical protein
MKTTDLLVFLLSSLASSSIYASKWIGVNIGQCDSAIVQFSVLKEVGVCLPTPSTISFFRSYQIPSCSITDSMLSTSITVYSGADCTGASFNQAIDPISTDCVNGTSIICEENPAAITENWPALGVYIEDTSCSAPSVVIAAKPDCTPFEYETYTYSSQLTCDTNLLTLNVYNTSMTCEGNAQLSETLAVDTCTEITDFLSNIPDNLPTRLQQFADLIDISSAFYYVDCGGVTNLPGVEGNTGSDDKATDDTSEGSSGSSSGSDATKYGGLGTVGLSVLLIGIVAAGVVGAFFVKRFATSVGHKDERQNNLL